MLLGESGKPAAEAAFLKKRQRLPEFSLTGFLLEEG